MEALEDMVAAFNEALELFCGPEVPSDDPTKMMFTAYVRFDTDGRDIDERIDQSAESRRERESQDRVAVEIARLAQGTPIIGYHDEDGYLVIPAEYDDDYLGDGDPRIRERKVIERIESDHRSLLENSSAPVDPALKDVVLNEFPLQAVFDARDRTDDCFIFAAIALENICIYHPFADGNKRTALATALRILDAGGFTLPDGTGLSRYVKEVAMGLHDRDEIAEWLKENAIGLRGP